MERSWLEWVGGFSAALQAADLIGKFSAACPLWWRRLRMIANGIWLRVASGPSGKWEVGALVIVAARSKTASEQLSEPTAKICGCDRHAADYGADSRIVVVIVMPNHR